MESVKEGLNGFLQPEIITKIIFAVIGILVLWLCYRIFKKLYKKLAYKKLKSHTYSIIETAIKYIFYVLLIIYVLGIFDIKLTALFGAAGIAGIAIGFAAQTSISNIISGFFILSEHALKIGDYITVDDVSGTVDAIELLSIRIKTKNNKMIRIPNEAVLNKNLQNTSFYPTRRIDFEVSIAYESDMEKALAVLKEVPKACDLVLQNGNNVCYYDGFGDSGINMILGVWINNENLHAAKNQVFIAIKKAFDESGIDIPFPQVCVRNV